MGNGLRLAMSIGSYTQWVCCLAMRSHLNRHGVGSRLICLRCVAFNGDVTVSDVSGRADISWIKNLLPLFVAGDITADIETLRVTAAGVPKTITGRVVWENAAWQAMGGDVSLGTYAIDITTTDQGISGKVVTLKGALDLTGELTLKGDRYSVTADLSGTAARNEAFQQAIALMAVPTESGYRIDLSGTL